MSQVRRRLPGWLLPVGIVVVGLVVVALLNSGSSADRPLDPRADGRLGTSALAALAGELGADVDVADELPGDDTDVTVLFTDLLDEEQSDELEDWVRAGGTLVVPDPGSSFAPPRAGGFFDADELDAAVGPVLRCDIDALDALDLGAIEPRNGGVLYTTTPGGETCVGGPGGAYIVATPTGAGTVVAVGGSGMLVNAALAEGENAPVVAALVAPAPGTRVTLVEPGPLAGGGGSRTLADLIAPNVYRALAQLGVAFAVFALWRARRLGRPVDEPQPVAVAGSELVAAVGSLLDRAGTPQHAAEQLRADLRRFLGDRLGVPPEAPADAIATVAEERVGADRPRIVQTLSPVPVTDDAQLVALAQTIDAIREEVLDHV